MKIQFVVTSLILLLGFSFGCVKKEVSIFDQVREEQKLSREAYLTMSSYDTPGMYAALPNNGEGSFE